jgi:SAM-dependent methyltransferase
VRRSADSPGAAFKVSLLSVQPADQVLEIGFGPGLAIAALVRAGAGHVYGSDRSCVMLRQASRRNAAGIRAGRVTLINSSVDQLPPGLDGPFDAILAVNSLGFWPAPAQRLAELRRRLASGGRIAIASQPRCPGATADSSRSPGNRGPAAGSRPHAPEHPDPTQHPDPPPQAASGVRPGRKSGPVRLTGGDGTGGNPLRRQGSPGDGDSRCGPPLPVSGRFG